MRITVVDKTKVDTDIYKLIQDIEVGTFFYGKIEGSNIAEYYLKINYAVGHNNSSDGVIDMDGTRYGLGLGRKIFCYESYKAHIVLTEIQED